MMHMSPNSILLTILITENGERVSAEEATTLKSRLRKIGPEEFIKETVSSQKYTAKRLCTVFGVIPPGLFDGRPDTGYYRLLGLAIIRELASRQKLTEYNTIDDVAKLLKERENIMVITGAGVSTKVVSLSLQVPPPLPLVFRLLA